MENLDEQVFVSAPNLFVSLNELVAGTVWLINDISERVDSFLAEDLIQFIYTYLSLKWF